MKREIKFRIPHFKLSDDSFSHFSYWGWIDYKGESSDSSFTSPSQNSHTYRKDDDQFTGLKDKNGKEIYEGDIIRGGYLPGVQLVEWDDIGSGFDPFTLPGLGGYEWDREVPEECEVIGNIYENPELIK